MTKKLQKKNHLKADKRKSAACSGSKGQGRCEQQHREQSWEVVSPSTTQHSESICRKLQLVWGSQYEPDINNMQWMQRRATKVLKALEHLPCEGQAHSTQTFERTL